MSPIDFCGLDFGTSNSTIGIYDGNQINMVALEGHKTLMRSALFFDYDHGGIFYGQEAVREYLTGTHGRIMVALKSVLGSSLMKENTLIKGKSIPYTQILGRLIGYIKEKAEKSAGHELKQVVLGRPVRFHDEDDVKDKLAEHTLAEVARTQGFSTIEFQYEPIAAALAFEETIKKEQLALIIDLGGGTSDFSVIRLRPEQTQSDRKEDVLANRGIHIGGTDFDYQMSLHHIMPELGLGGDMRGISHILQIPSSIYYDLSTWHTINSLYTHQTAQHIKMIQNAALKPKAIARLAEVIHKQYGHKILALVEDGKCLLSDDQSIDLNLSFIEDNFTINISRKIFEDTISSKVSDLVNTVNQTLADALISHPQIESVFFTGGSTQIPIIRQSIISLFPNANIIQGDVFNSVGRGLIIDAKRKFYK